MLDTAFEALAKYDWGQDPKVLKPIDEAVVAAHDDEAVRADLEARLATVLESDATYDGKQFACRKLMVIGTAASVSKLAALLADEKLSHMARYALERYTAPEAAAALRESLPKLAGELKIGVIGSLGVRGDQQSIGAISELLEDKDVGIARAAATALGDIRTESAAKALSNGKANPAAKLAVIDASLACAEEILAAGNKATALAIYKSCNSEDLPKHVRLAATRGMLACAGT